jgi:hypothetical protein
VNSPSGTLQIRVFSSLTVSFSLPMSPRRRQLLCLRKNLKMPTEITMLGAPIEKKLKTAKRDQDARA